MDKEIDIKRLRKDLQESRRQFAARFGITQQAVGIWERKGLPRSQIVRKVIADLRRRTPYNEGTE